MGKRGEPRRWVFERKVFTEILVSNNCRYFKVNPKKQMNKHRKSLYEVAGNKPLTWVLVTCRHKTKMGHIEGLALPFNGFQISFPIEVES
jgi:hypothetical protein